MTAQECYDNVMNLRGQQRQNEKDIIFKAIQDDVAAKRMGTQVGFHVDTDIRSELESAGFKVTCGSQYNEPYTNISWDLKR